MGRNGDGIREASESSYEIAFTYKGVRCRERIKIKPSTTNRRRVANHLAAIQDSISKGTFDYAVTFPDSTKSKLFAEYQGEVLKIEQYLDEWLTMKAKQCKSSTMVNYIKIVNNLIIPQFKGTPISDIKRPDIRKWLSGITGTNKYLSNVQSVLRSALQDAVNDEILEINPMVGWTYTNKEAPKPNNDVDPFTAEEQALILAEMDGQVKNMFQFFFWTGLRTSELVALNWEDIDWLHGKVHIYKGITQGVKSAETTKTASGVRKVKLLKPALEALENQKQFTGFKNEEIFQNPILNERWKGDAPIRKTAWMPAVRRSKVKYRRPYQTRHTYASMMLTAGESIPWLAEQMGHSDWAMLRKIYAKFIKDSIPDAGEKAVEMFSKNAGIKAVINNPNSPKKLA